MWDEEPRRVGTVIYLWVGWGKKKNTIKTKVRTFARHGGLQLEERLNALLGLALHPAPVKRVDQTLDSTQELHRECVVRARRVALYVVARRKKEYWYSEKKHERSVGREELKKKVVIFCNSCFTDEKPMATSQKKPTCEVYSFGSPSRSGALVRRAVAVALSRP